MMEKIRKPSVVVLAAGESQRFGSPKGLMSFDNKFWIDHQIETLLRMHLEPVTIVLGRQAPLYQASSRFLQGPSSLVRTVINSRPEDGSFSSLQVGLRAMLEANPQSDGTFVLPVDVPAPSRETIDTLLECRAHDTIAALPSFFAQGGHPVWISMDFAKQLLLVPIHDPDARLDYQIRKQPIDQVVRVSVDDSKILLNLNYREGFAEFARAELQDQLYLQ